MLRDYGNMSSATLPHIWARLAADPAVAWRDLSPASPSAPASPSMAPCCGRLSMTFWAWIVAPVLFLVHGAAMVVDEAWFHRRRGLPRWERWGHPADTLTVLSATCWPWPCRAAPPGFAVYAGAAALSTLFVTKDEWIHARTCTGRGDVAACLPLLPAPGAAFPGRLHGWASPAPPPPAADRPSSRPFWPARRPYGPLPPLANPLLERTMVPGRARDA